ncbi:unnamed protein product [Paramecium sonneborni]|uniref:Malate dehydrogenase n=1 Tax=Paramecium sonneborni TaxID=65129 RepID=A0A8S1QN36_9CILI|nr:unnamed protein product [Paramecium sonneborni]
MQKYLQKAICNQLTRASIAHFGQSQKPPVRVAITGAAGQIGYSLIFRVASGEMLGPDQPVILHLIDLPFAMAALNGVVMEIQDCAFPLVQGIVATDNQAVGFKDVNYALLVGAKPRGPGMERGDLLKDNGKIFTETGKYINDNASRDIKVVVVGNPCNTNCLILANQIKDIPKENFTAMTRLDHNRAQHQLADKLGVHSTDIRKIAIFGNHSPTMVPYIDQMTAKNHKATVDQQWVTQTFIPTVQQRGAEIIKARKLSSAASAGNAAMNHITTWVNGTAEGDYTSMAIPSDGSYGVPKGLIFSFPVTVKNGKYSIVQGLPISPFYQGLLDKTIKELVDERSAVDHLLK